MHRFKKVDVLETTSEINGSIELKITDLYAFPRVKQQVELGRATTPAQLESAFRYNQTELEQAIQLELQEHYRAQHVSIRNVRLIHIFYAIFSVDPPDVDITATFRLLTDEF